MKTVVICGASSGLGKAALKKFVENGWKAINIDLSPDADYSCDLSDFEKTGVTFKQIVQDHGPVSCLVNSIRYRNRVEVPSWELSLKVNLNTYYNSSYWMAELMKGVECSIINVSSVAAQAVTLYEDVGYHVAKAGIDQMTRYFAVKYGPQGLRANSILPGLISKEKAEPATGESLYAKIARHIPLRRSGAPEEVASLILFLSTASFITGQSICIDGGLNIRDQVDCTGLIG